MTEQQSIYERIGGQATVDKLIDTFYERVLSDPELKPFFEHSAMDKQRKMQKEFFSAALGGPLVYSGASLQAAHAGRGITSHHLTRFTEHLIQSLKAYQISDADVNSIVAHIGTFANEILGEAGVDG